MTAETGGCPTCHDGDAQTHVVIVYRDALFAQGIASLLRAEGTAHIVGMPADDGSAPERIRALRPTVVILEGQEQDDLTLVPALLDIARWVVKVGLDRDAVEIYRRTHLVDSHALARLVTRLTCRADRVREGR